MMWLFRLLLVLYPTSFRRSYGRDMAHVFERKLSGAEGGGEVVRIYGEAVVDVFRHALPLHLDYLMQDTRHLKRALGRSPVFTLSVVLIAGLGIGANSAVFSVVDHVLLKPIPFENPETLVRIWETPPGYTYMEASPPNYLDWREMNSSFDEMAAYTSMSANLVGDGEPERISGAIVTGELFPLLGMAPVLGRFFDDREGTGLAAPAVLISYGLWQRRFAGDSAVLGNSINLDGTSRQVVGVMPEEFRFPNRETEFWSPLVIDPGYDDRNDNYLHVVARLDSGVSLDMARSDMLGVMRRLEEAYPEANDQNRATINLVSDEVPSQTRSLLFALVGAAVCVLLIACTNLANLLFARAATRRTEFAVRVSLGAGRSRLIRQLVTESMVLSILGGAVGLLLAYVSLPVLMRLVPSTLPIPADVSIDPRVLWFTLGVSVVTGLGFGLLPAMNAGASAITAGLRESDRGGGHRSQRLRSVLVVVEIATTVVLLVSAGLLVRTLSEVKQVDPGFDTEGVLTARTWLPIQKYPTEAARSDYFNRVISELRATPGVESAGFTSFLPLVMRGGIWPVQVNGEDLGRRQNQTASLRFITSEFLEAIGVPLVRGRWFEEGDSQEGQPVAIVSESLVERYWPGEDALGRTIGFAFNERTIVGVVGDVRFRGLERPSEPQVYLPHSQAPDGGLVYYVPKDLAVKFDGDPATLAPRLREIVREADPQQPLQDVRLMADIVQEDTASRGVQLKILSAFTALAFLLAAVGIHGLLSVTVTQRTREIGVRLALGAGRDRIMRMMFREGVLLGGLGITIGVVAGLMAARWLGALLFGVAPMDPITFGFAILLTVIMTLVSSLPPALRAASHDPVEIIR